MAAAPRGRPRPSYNRSLSTKFKSLNPLTDASLIQDELLEHSRFIRDWLVPMLDKGCQIPETEIEILSEILERLGSLRITVELLRYSRVEKGLLAILETESFAWPTRIVEKSRYLLRKWEISLGQPCASIRADFFGSHGRLESLSVATFRRSSAPELVCLPLASIDGSKLTVRSGDGDNMATFTIPFVHARFYAWERWF